MDDLQGCDGLQVRQPTGVTYEANTTFYSPVRYT